MKIKSLTIRNFRTFDEEGISLTLKDLTTLVGENNTGKSNVLEALDLFLNFSPTKLSKESFHHDDNTKEISIEINFGMLSEAEKAKFKIHLNEKKQLEIKQIIKLSASEEDDDESKPKYQESKHGTKWEAVSEWAMIGPKPPTKTNIKSWWKQDLRIGDFDFKSLFDKKDSEPDPEAYQMKLEQLWDEHFDTIPKEKKTGDEKVLGWKNKLKGNLPKYFYIPAIKDVNDDLKVLKNNPFGEIIGWLTQNITAEMEKDFKEKTETIFNEVMGAIDKDSEGKSKIAFLNNQLNANLGVNLDCKLELRFGTPQMSDVIFPSPQLYADDGYYSIIDLKGNGLQRLCIMSLLRTYNDVKKRIENVERNVIIAIEEPEIYLHPPIKRATYKLLRLLSEGNDQIIYSTHDSHFVSVEHFDEIRLFRKSKGEKPVTKIHEFGTEELVRHYKDCYKISVDEKSLRHRFAHICDDTKNEGFYANKVVLIEGETEKYALPIYFNHAGFDVDKERVAIISAGSVDNISYLYVIFNEFHIPCYIIFDGDRPDVDYEELNKKENEKKREDALNKSRRNKELLRLAGETFDEDAQFLFPATTVKDTYAVWEQDFEQVFHRGVDKYEEIKGEATKLYGTKSKPLAGRYFASELVEKYPDKISPYVDELVYCLSNIFTIAFACAMLGACGNQPISS
jgi:predicted ATP-dependent endonuclease of OLD family